LLKEADRAATISNQAGRTLPTRMMTRSITKKMTKTTESKKVILETTSTMARRKMTKTQSTIKKATRQGTRTLIPASLSTAGHMDK